MRSSPRRAAALLVAALGLVAGALGLGASPAGAHGDVGVIEVDVPEPTGDLAVSLRIRLTYENDAEPVTEDEVGEISVDGSGPDSATIGPVTDFVPTDVPGVYSVDLTFPAPGSWDLTITSVEPEATASSVVEIAEATTTTTSDAADAVEEETTTTLAGTAEIVERGDDDQTPLLVTLIVAAVVIAGVVGAVWFWRRHGGPTEVGADPSDESGGGPSS